MKINGEFILREIAGEYLLVPAGATAMTFNGMIILSATGATVWQAIARGEGIEQAVSNILDEYDIDEATVRTDVAALVEKLKANRILNDE